MPRDAPADDRLPASPRAAVAAQLVPAAAVLVLGVLTWLDAAGLALVWSNAMWLVAAATAALQARLAPAAASRAARSVQRAFGTSLWLYLAGQVAWAVQMAVGFTPLPGPSDLAFLASAACAARAFLLILRSRVEPAERRFVDLDAGVTLLAAFTTLLAVRSSGIVELPPGHRLTLLAYPVLWLLPAFSAILVIAASQRRLRSPAGRSLAAGWLLVGLGFLVWTEAEVRGSIHVGHLADYLYPLGLLLAGRGIRRWRRDASELMRLDRPTQRLLDALPALWIGVAVTAVGVVELRGTADPLIHGFVLALVAAVTLRQLLLARHRRAALEREREATRRADRALERERAAHQRLELVANTLDDAFWITGRSPGELEYVSPGFEKLFGRPVDELEADPDLFLEMVHRADRERVRRAMARRVESEGGELEYRIVRPDGSVRTVRDRAIPVRDADGEIVRFVGVASDTTEITAAHQANRLLAQALEQAGESVLITDARRRITYANPASVRISGYPVEEMLGRDPEFMSRDSWERSEREALWRTVEAGGVWRGRIVSRRKDGTVLEEEAVVVPVRDRLSPDGSPSYVAVKRDLTAQRAMERRLLESHRMEAVGRVAGGIAHDFNSLLMVILNYTEMTMERLAADDPSRAELGDVLEAGKRAAELTWKLLAFSRQQVLRPERLDVARTIATLAPMLRRLLPDGVRLERRLADGAAVRCDPGQLEQVVIDLVRNAGEATAAGGTVTVETGEERIGTDDPRLAEGLAPGRWVRLTVRDTGTGMDEATRRRAFEPFFTTKPPGEGTGLGLSSAFGFVRQSGGSMLLDSRPGEGTAVHVLLPRADDVGRRAASGSDRAQ